jgi:hypothetical protein
MKTKRLQRSRGVFVLGLSLITHASAHAQGRVLINNYVPPLIDAPVFDTDCRTRLEGDVYHAQGYAGLTPTSLQPVAPITSFRTGLAAGYVLQAIAEVPVQTDPNQPVYVQLRAWDAAAGLSYEATVASGGKYGFSNIVPVQPGFGAGTTPYLEGLQSFCLIPEPPTWALGPIGGILLWVAVGRRSVRSNTPSQRSGHLVQTESSSTPAFS